jgi:hypothetical protein
MLSLLYLLLTLSELLFEGTYSEILFFVIPFHLQSVPVHSANCVQNYAMAEILN